MCEHKQFDAKVRVIRLEDSGKFMLEINCNCIECGTPMQFIGASPGFNFNGPTVSLDGLELSIPIAPQGTVSNPFQKIMQQEVAH